MDANELLSLKILKDANPQAFANLAAEETKWLSLSLGLLRRDSYLQMMMGGKGVRQAMRLAAVLKQKAEQTHFNRRIDGVVQRMVSAKFLENGWNELKPVGSTKIKEFLGKNKDSEGIFIKPMNKSVFVYGDTENNVDINEDIDIIMKDI